MRRLLTASPAQNEKGEVLVFFSADRTSGIQEGRTPGFGGGQVFCVPFAEQNPPPRLSDRKFVLITVPVDTVLVGHSNLTFATGYHVHGSRRTAPMTGPPRLDFFSNRKQFLRNQYLQLALGTNVALCATTPVAVEWAYSLETS